MRLGEAYEAMVAVAARHPYTGRITEMRRAFEARTGRFDAGTPGLPVDEGWFEARSRAFWDDALTRQGLASEVAPELAPEARTWVPALLRAHRGLFRARRVEGTLVFADVWGGAEFVVNEVDDASRDAVAAASAPFDARLVGRDAVVALLPGAVFHPAEAEDAMGRVLEIARARSLATDEVLDALLRMELALRTLSRVKPAYAYRAEALG